MTASKPKTPTASAISRLLAAAGFERSESSATRIKGYRRSSEGFIVEGYGPGDVRVYHASGEFRSASSAPYAREMEGRYAETITAAGYAAEIVEAHRHGVRVTAKTED